MLYLCMLPTQPHSLCSPRWQNTPVCLNWYNTRYFYYTMFTFYHPVFYATHKQHFPSESEERAGYWVGFAVHYGDAMTHKLLDHETQKLSIEVLLDLGNLPLSTLGLHHMEGRFLHLLTVLKIQFPLDNHWYPQKVLYRYRRPYSSHQVQK